MDLSRSAWRSKALARGAKSELQLQTAIDLLALQGAALTEFGGERGSRSLADAARAAGFTIGQRYQREHDVSGRNAISSSAPAIVALETFEAKYEVDRARSSQTEISVVQCPLRARARIHGPAAERACCDACGESMRGLVEAINPDAQAAMPQRQGWGDERCRLVVTTTKAEPGPDGLDVPHAVRYMPSSTRRRLFIEMITQIIADLSRTPLTLDASAQRRVAARAGQLAGLSASKGLARQVRVDGASLNARLEAVFLYDDALGMEPSTVEGDPLAWRARACGFLPQRPRAEKARSSLSCETCRHVHQSILEEGGASAELHIVSSIERGDARCEFRARPLPSQVLARTGTGWLDRGAARVAVMDAETTYYSLWSLLGETLEHVGRRAGEESARQAVRSGAARKEETGLQAVLDELAATGLGRFAVPNIDLAAPTASVRCFDSFEVAAVRRQAKLDAPVCHFLRGAVAGVVAELSGERRVRCVEKECAALGAPHCVFELTSE